MTKALPLLNLGSAAATVDLRVELEDEDGGPAPAGMLSVTPSRLTLGCTRLDQGGDYGLAMSFGAGGAAAETGLYAEPTDPARVGQFEVELRIRLLPAGTSSPATASTLYDLLLFGGRVPDPPCGWSAGPASWPG